MTHERDYLTKAHLKSKPIKTALWLTVKGSILKGIFWSYDLSDIVCDFINGHSSVGYFN